VIRKHKAIKVRRPSVRVVSHAPRRSADTRVLMRSQSAWDNSAWEQQRVALAQRVGEEAITGRLIAAIVPVLSRPQRVQPLVDSFRAATKDEDAAIYFVAQASDTAELAAIRAAGLEPIVVGDEDRSWAKKINRGYQRTHEPWILLGADDLSFRPGWIDVIRGELLSFEGVLGTNDLGNVATTRGQHSTHPLVRRAYADCCGTVDCRGCVVHEGYDHNFPDTELVATAKRRGLYRHRVDCIIEHLHPLWGKAKSDPVYALGQRSFTRDHDLFVSRSKRFGF